MAGIIIDGVGKRFGAVTALADVSLQISDGEFFVLLGPSGCGKSTLLRVIAGLVAASYGRVVIGERDVTGLSPAQRDIAMVFQSYALYPHLTVRRNLAFGLGARRRGRRDVADRVAAAARRLALEELLERRPRELSGGQRQRVALGRAIVRNPSAFLMDEPLSNLDAQLRTSTRLELSQLHQELAATFVFVTHDQIEAMTMATRIGVLNGGVLEQVGTPAEVYDDPASLFVARFLGAPPMNLVPARISADGGRLVAAAEGVRVGLWEGAAPAREVVLGVRPEKLRLVSPGEQTALHGTVVGMENLGSDEVAICDVGGVRVSLRGPRPLGLTVGDRVRCGADVADLRFFDPQSGRRLLWQDPERGRVKVAADRWPVAG